MKNNFFEFLIGIIVLTLCLGFVIFIKTHYSYNISGSQIKVILVFDNSEGISIGSEVKTLGVKIGEVKSIKLDSELDSSLVEITIDDSIKIPNNSTAYVRSSSLIGAKYIEFVNGDSKEVLKNGDKVTSTESGKNLEDLIDKFILNFAKKL